MAKKKRSKKKSEKKKKEEESGEEGESEDYELTDLPGIGPAVSSKLENAGIRDLMGLAVASPATISDTAGISESVARKAITAARDMLDLGFQNGMEVVERQKKNRFITTGSENFDNLLGGKGVETRAITESFGAYGSGKCVSKDTPLFYFEGQQPRIESSEEAYKKSKEKFGEKEFDNGMVVPLQGIEVIGLSEEKLKKTEASYLYKEFVDKIFEVETKKGRKLKITGSHKLLSFSGGLKWKPASQLGEGEVIAYPKEINLPTSDSGLDEDDAYFLGLFSAEGTRNPLSISTGNKKIVSWLEGYIRKKFDYNPTINSRKKAFRILLREKTKDILGDLTFCNSSNKFVPKKILFSGERIVKNFLAGYLDGDGEVADVNAEMTTKSERLCRDLGYLFLTVGISAVKRKKKIKDKEYYRLFIVGEDRLKLNSIPFKIKEASYTNRNSSYGYTGEIIDYLRESYKETLGGNRGREGKELGRKNNEGDIFYEYLTNSSVSKRNMNTKTLQRIKKAFNKGLKRIDKAISLLEFIENKNKFKEMYHLLPFPFNSVAEDVGLTKAGIGNYVSRGLPSGERCLEVKQALARKLKSRREKLVSLLRNLDLICNFRWDEIVSVRQVDYNDYVYDFVVPEGHCFVGGDIPTMMHNSQLGFTLAVNVQLPQDKGGANGKAVIIDTEGTFRPKRIREIAEAKGANPKKVLKNIFVARAFNSSHQMLLVDKVKEMIDNGEPIKLVVIDSLTAHFRAEYTGRGQLADRQQTLNRYIHDLTRLAEQYNVAVFVTNQVMEDPSKMFGDPTTAIGGNIVGHASTYRLYLRRGKKDSRVAKLIDSPNLPDNECVFYITNAGIRDERPKGLKNGKGKSL